MKPCSEKIHAFLLEHEMVYSMLRISVNYVDDEFLFNT